MSKYLNFFKIELKRTIKLYPKMLMVATILLCLVIGIFFIGTKFFYTEKDDLKINIVVVQEEPDTTTDMALMYVKSMKTFSDTCSLHNVDKETGFAMLENGEASALIYLPKDVIGGIMNGTNTPAEVYFPKNANIESTIIKEFVNPAIHMLKVAQAQIYAINDTAYEYNMYHNINNYEHDINEYNLDFAINRLDVYKNHSLSKMGKLNIFQHYVVYGIIAFLLLFSMSLYPIMKNYNKAFTLQAKKYGISPNIIQANKTIISLFVYIITFSLLYLMSSFLLKNVIELPSLTFNVCLSILIVFVSVVSFAQLLYKLGNGNVSSILSIFFISILMIYASGGIIPNIYLPEIIQSIGKFLPTTFMKNVLECIYTRTNDYKSIAILIIYSLIFMFLSFLYENLIDRKVLEIE